MVNLQSRLASAATSRAVRVSWQREEFSRTVRSWNKLVTRSSRVCLLLTAYTSDRSLKHGVRR